MKPVARRHRRTLLAAFVICAAVLSLLFLRKYRMSLMKPAIPPQQQEAGTIVVSLFFASPDDQGLVREAREIDACSDTANCAEEVIGELINGPMGDMAPTLPTTAALRSVRLDGDTAFVDLADEFTEGLPHGSHAEMMAIYSIVDSLAFNFPRIKKVQFLLEGANVSSLGHLDLGSPLTPDFSLEKKQ